MDLQSIWRNMHSRCYRPTATGYRTIGGRGIKVAQRWHDFELFAQDVGTPPHKKYRLARKNPDADYGPDNCTWMAPEAPPIKVNTCWYTNGVFKGTLAECAKKLNISRELARWRFKTWGTFKKGEKWRQLERSK